MEKIIFIIGVSGSGKTTVGRMLATALSVPFIDADDHHPATNVEKMSRGIPLNDADREPWLDALHRIAQEHIGSGCVIACSALKEDYRKRLAHSIGEHVQWVYLKGSYDQIFERMQKRKGHFMESAMLKSQFDALEEPKHAIRVDIIDSPERIVQHIQLQLSMKTDFGVIGLGVMGKSLSRNLARNGFRLSLYNRHVDGIEEHVATDFKRSYPELEQALPFDDMKGFVTSLEAPRKMILMVNAGPAVDAVIGALSEHLEPGDIIIDGGNSHYKETQRRMADLKEKGIHFIGAGISGGEAGALNGPSIMPSGDSEAYAQVQPYLEAIAAKDDKGKPCCARVGGQGSGHFVKMIHNGIEYVEMQLLAECYAILKSQGQSNEAIATVFESWKNDLGSYLLEISIAILRKKEGGDYVLDHILDKAGNKGTGKWSTTSIADSGEAATMIPAALFARYLSFFKEKREEASRLFSSQKANIKLSALQLKEAYQFGRIINHHQGFSIIARVSEQHNWQVNLSDVARIWTEGCIIKSDLMKELARSLKADTAILFHEPFSDIIKKTHASAQAVAMACIQNEIHIPCLLEAANFFHGIKTAQSPANLIQAQRDYFGAHTYQRVDDPSGNSHHSHWN
ncbi:MAG: NADP-dependent phosphogluconate dehydrogenase [Bacteroidia bacterium]